MVSDSPIDNIKIIFNIDNIINIRNIKKPYSIAEYGIEDYLFLSDELDYVVANNIISNEDADKLFKIIKQAIKNKSLKEYYKVLNENFPYLKSNKKKRNI